MALKTRGIVTQVAKEITFNVAPTFTDNDVVSAESATINPKVDTVDRKVLSCSLIKEAGIPVRFTTDGEISLEIDGKVGVNDFYGAVLYEAGLGAKSVPGTGTGGLIGFESDGITAADKVSKPDSTVNGTATLYTVADGLDKISLAVRKFYDSGDVVLLSTGNVVNKVSLNFSQADILTASFGLEGCKFEEQFGLTKPTCPTLSEAPFVGKNAKFKFAGQSVDAKNITVDIANTITNEEAITVDGYSNKFVVEKTITGSFVALMTDFSYLNMLKNSTIGELYLEIQAGSKKLGLYIPRLKVTEVTTTDNSGMLIEVSVTFQAEKDNIVGEALLLAIQS